MKLRYVLAAVALVLCVMPATAQPACLQGWDQYSDALVVCDANGFLFDFVTATEAQEAGGGAVFLLNAARPDPAQFGNATTLCEFAGPCDNSLPPSAYSDIFGVYQDANGALFLAFSSDDETGLAFGSQGAIYLTEHPGWYNATMYLDPVLVGAGFSAWFQSEPVPEPGTLLLIGSGIGLLARKLRKKT